MARTAQMRLIELMVLKQDISRVIEYIGKKGSFQFQSRKHSDASEQKGDEAVDTDGQIYKQLLDAATYLGIQSLTEDLSVYNAPSSDTRNEATGLIAAFNELCERINAANDSAVKVNDSYKEAMAFSNLHVSYSELEHLSFLSIKIGKLPAEEFDSLKDSLMANAVVVPLGDDKTRIMVASSKKGRFALESELKNHGFIEMEVPKDFKGVPADVLESLKTQKAESDALLKSMETEKANFTETHKEKLVALLGAFAIGVQIDAVKKTLESTELVYRVSGWIPEKEQEAYMTELDQLTEGRVAIRIYEPYEVPSVMANK